MLKYSRTEVLTTNASIPPNLQSLNSNPIILIKPKEEFVMSLFQAIAATAIFFGTYYTLIYLVVVVFMGQGRNKVRKKYATESFDK